MNFTNLKHFLFDNVQTVLLLVGFILIAIAISFLTNIYYGLLALGVECILVALMINYEKGG
ncbi:hypothetical protein TK11N_16640 [Tetragenococcus koreensis]|uniref:DUF1056 domain-containing protein n=1 Tax=Tetragenococcus koreensis TaxID=290335 RepID=A0AAN4ZQ34_9ENTE|nr:hypothetical protein TK11N_16640 [Tetragenococcus koreensis]GEQ52251.1 hypothetical protein TK12N_15950 [Tetragenococcus koreensis]GEQ54786.1 hypothetical protein TK2N_16300 [Tetragenococcus koreensis]GEQ57260.1 hypothetical protein TK4N_16030 [Tetragenococcus koreensis]GEQ59818.1 hypothetical protein TK6N_16570 [Tetragenococcus koreensis]